jgi:ribonucleoside-diphosphate reductase alpha chain
VRNPFQKNAYVDWRQLENTVEVATRFLDNVVDISQYPLESQCIAASNTRRIGLGFTGLADTLVMLNMAYGSKESLSLTQEITQKIAFTTWLTSAKLANEKQSFPLFNCKKYLEGQFVRSLPNEIRNEIKKNGMRNSHHNAIAPTGSISLLANNISNGIEPIFSSSYERNVRNLEGETVKFRIKDYAFYHYQKLFNTESLPESWRDVLTLSPSDHLAIQGVVQPYIDNAISKTINIPEKYPLSKLMGIYKEAHLLKLKGCTIFRPNPTTGSVLSTDIDRCCVTTRP